jgi:PiT family inorganic phosphate transporter
MLTFLGAAALAFGAIFVAEFGDKSQLLILAFATRYAARPVILGLVVAAALMIGITWVIRRRAPGTVNRVFRRLQLVSGGFVAFTHGTNDAQKTMGIIALALIASGHLDSGADPPTWVVVSAATAIALGTYVGGWRIIRTMGSRIIKMDPAQGFAAQSVGASVILSATHVGFPLSTTHVISGAIMGAGAAKRISAVRWGVAGNIAVAWVLTLPAAAIVGAVTYGVTRIFGGGAAGPVVVTAVLLALLGWVFTRRLAGGRTLTAEG